ncbi:hypothetical protein QAD02_006831 [Eretmocerus hayati]|uniref:Uncharacterized protein n=1 Tax=Eretmocerus hayati TaxID=131215 RepID=A0ACC2N1Y9_9HYME|nr:hypothetical protein QAD02_006831 [Eretmocerus hayati]
MATRWGIVGSGKISHDFVSALKSLPCTEHEIVAVAARDESRAKEFARAHGIAKAFGSYEELARDADIDIAYIGTLHTSHLEVGKMMLNAGKHVLCEKPLTMNLKQTKELIDLAKSKGLFLMEAIWSRCFPAYETLRKELDNKSIGEVKHVIASLGGKMPHVERLNRKELGGGTVLDLGVYVIQLVCLVLNHEKPTEIKTVGHTNDEGVDLSMSTSMTYSKGQTATIVTSSEVTLPNEAIIIGTEGMIRIPDFWCPAKIILPNGEVTVPLPKSDLNFNFKNSIGLSYEASEVRGCLKKGLKESSKVAHDHSLLIASIQDEIRQQIGVVYDVDNS